MRRVARAFLVIAAAAVASPIGSQTHGDDQLVSVAKHAYGEYMAPPRGCDVTTEAFMGWAAGTLRRCNYSVIDHYRDGTVQTKRGLVYLATFPPARLAAWLRTACARAAVGSAQAACVASLVKTIQTASGAQFAVAGLVWEDQYCKDPRGQCRYKRDEHGSLQPDGDGVYEPYVFRAGVTVKIVGVENGVPDRPGTHVVLVPTQAELEGYVSAALVGISPGKGFARVASTTRASFARLTHRRDVPVGRGDAQAAVAWSRMVGETFRTALSSDDNPLLDARACDDHGWPAACR